MNRNQQPKGSLDPHSQGFGPNQHVAVGSGPGPPLGKRILGTSAFSRIPMERLLFDRKDSWKPPPSQLETAQDTVFPGRFVYSLTQYPPGRFAVCLACFDVVFLYDQLGFFNLCWKRRTQKHTNSSPLRSLPIGIQSPPNRPGSVVPNLDPRAEPWHRQIVLVSHHRT